MNVEPDKLLASAHRVLDIELEAIANLKQAFDQQFIAACQIMLACKGKVVVTGMGKSGHIANKIAATLASTGTPAFFMHPGEAGHGDLGMLGEDDVLLAISNSGETSEVLSLLPVVKRLGIEVIAMTRSPESSMGRYADIHLSIAVPREACSLGLAPTSSTSVTLVLGDALAVALLDAKNFTAEEFALSHPSGSLGKKLLLTLNDIMHSGDRVPLVAETSSIRDALVIITQKSLGLAGIVDAEGKLIGIFTDGDLRRVIDAHKDVHNTRISEVMTRNCFTAHREMLAAEALNEMENRNISSLIVVDAHNRPVGALNMLDLIKSGVV
ncbi:KpsF/GutQ family sugar-phosphate isomerase [Planctobacterium marinum]|uniref:Arabinose 5-phosphate isomerase n=1 Tax=Planctobacterium marinum TaxID=1631968 RepID=A0AA48HIA7_9ALTE|nr:arabinose 5-phosphate isomerase [Planctobacterium marinum]